MSQTTSLAQGAQVAAGSRAGVAWPALLAAALGLFILFGVGFAAPMTIHNAAHDARHAHSFPCH